MSHFGLILTKILFSIDLYYLSYGHFFPTTSEKVICFFSSKWPPQEESKCKKCAFFAMDSKRWWCLLFTYEFFRNSRAKFIPKCLMSNESPDRMKKIFMDEENLGNIARFAKTIMKVFTFKRNLDIQPPSKKNTTVTRSGRQVKPPTKLNLWIDIKCKDAYYFQVCLLS